LQSAIDVSSGLNSTLVPDARAEDETNAATWSISLAESLLLNDGIPFPPVRTWCSTVDSSGFNSSRLGPT
jgi:hypothetical protein